MSLPLCLRPIPIVVAAVIGCSCGAAAAETSTTAQIYQQRDADGRTVLTDRPSAKAVTERTWQVDREDPQAARQRALEVKREADAVSERIQRRIEAQERRASEADLLRMRLAMLEHQSYSSDLGSDVDGDAVIVVPGGFRPFAQRRAFDNHRPQQRPSRLPMRPAMIRGPASLQSF